MICSACVSWCDKLAFVCFKVLDIDHIVTFKTFRQLADTWRMFTDASVRDGRFTSNFLKVFALGINRHETFLLLHTLGK